MSKLLGRLQSVRASRAGSPLHVSLFETEAETGPVDQLWRDHTGLALLGVTTRTTRLTQTKTARDGGSGNVLLVCRATGLRTRLTRWIIYDPKGRELMHVHVGVHASRKQEGSDPAYHFSLRANEPHHAPQVVGQPEDGRLVLRAVPKCAGEEGIALCEATVSPAAHAVAAVARSAGSSDSLGSDLASVRGSGAWQVGCHAAVAARADQPLMCALLTIYKAVLDAPGAAAAAKERRRTAKAMRRQRVASGGSAATDSPPSPQSLAPLSRLGSSVPPSLPSLNEIEELQAC